MRLSLLFSAKKQLGTVLLLLHLIFANGQKLSENLNFDILQDGISKRAITDIVQDDDGFIWFGTISTGIYRYDGINYTSYTYDSNEVHAISSNQIHCVFIDSANTVWAGTNTGLNRYNSKLDKFETIDLSKTLDAVPSNVTVRSLNEDGSGNVLVGTFGFGVLKIDPSTFKTTRLISEEAPRSGFHITSIKKAEDGIVFVATNRGLMKINASTDTLEEATFATKNGLETYQGPIESLLIDNQNNLWLGTPSKGIVKIRKEDQGSYRIKSLPITDKRILSMLAVDENHLLIGTENDGLYSIDADGKVLERYAYSKADHNSLASNSIWSLFSDKQARIWLGYYNKGVGVYDRLRNKFNALESLPNSFNSLQATSVTGIVKDERGRLWIGMEGGGVDVYNPKTQKFQHINNENNASYRGLESDDIQTVFIDSRQNIWVGSWNGGIYYLENGTKNFVNYSIQTTQGALTSNGILSFTEDSKGRIWIATFLRGLHYYDPKTKIFKFCDSEPFKKNGLTSADVRVVLADASDTIWAGTTGGLFKVTLDDDGLFSVSSMRDRMPDGSDHPSAHHILSMYEGTDEQLWVGTDGGGLFNYDREKNRLYRFDQIANFKETSVNAIVEDNQGTVWVCGKSGLTKLDLQKKEATNYTVDDGLLGNYFNNNAVLRNTDGSLYFGGYLGVNYFNPEDIEINTNPPSLYFTDLKLFNKRVSPNDKESPLDKVISETEAIALNHNQSVFTIEYSGIGFTRPEKNQYAYILEGFDEDWNYVGNIRSATYTNLPKGEYTFKVKAANNDGVWNKMPLELKITVLPPWWKTTKAYLVYALFFLLGSLMLYWFLRERFRERQAIRFERETRIQEEQLHKKKLQFFTNISHEFRTPLTLIKNPIEDLINDKGLDLPEEVKAKHHIIHKNSDRLSRLINELLDFRKLQSNKIPIQARKLDVVEYVGNTVSYFKEEAAHRHIELNFSAPANKLMAWVDPDMLEKILFNLLSNAFKVTPESGFITVSVQREKALVHLPLANKEEAVGAFTISVEDTGPGLDQREYKKIFKRFYQVAKLNKSYYGSTGIGLEMVKSFVELHKGIIDVESQIGEGTRFIVTIPLGKEHFSESDLQLATDNNGEQSPFADDIIKNEIEQDDKRNTLLIVEDNPELRDYLKNELLKHYNVIVAENGHIGLDIAKERLPHIILTDVIMPEMDGFEMCKKIKGDIKTSHIPLLMLTAKVMVEDKVEGIDSGADAYLTKPFNMEVLKSTLAQLLTSREILFNKNFDGLSETSKENTTTLDNVFVQKVLAYINENIDESNLSVELIASEFFLSRSHLYRKIKTLTGVSVNEFIRKVRLGKAKELLVSGNDNISEVAYKVGFTSPSYFTKCFKAEFGYLPTEMVNQ